MFFDILSRKSSRIPMTKRDLIVRSSGFEQKAADPSWDQSVVAKIRDSFRKLKQRQDHLFHNNDPCKILNW